jgi:hypothetical protein
VLGVGAKCVATKVLDDFHGETGAGIGPGHQTGWTGVIAFLIHGFTALEAEEVLEKGMEAVTEVSAEVAKEAAQTEVVQVAEEVHQQLARRSSPRWSKRSSSR